MRCVAEVIRQREENAVAGGCCERHANMKACNCMEEAQRYEAEHPAFRLYHSDIDFKQLVDIWVGERRCDLRLVDRCIELGQDVMAECARWAATERERPVFLPVFDEIRTSCGPYPSMAGDGHWYWSTSTKVFSGYANEAPLNMYEQPSHLSALDSILWLLDNWKLAE